VYEYKHKLTPGNLFFVANLRFSVVGIRCNSCFQYTPTTSTEVSVFQADTRAL